MNISPVNFCGLLKINQNINDKWNKRTEYVNTANVRKIDSYAGNTSVYYNTDKCDRDKFNIDCDTFVKAFAEAEANPGKIVEINERN